QKGRKRPRVLSPRRRWQSNPDFNRFGLRLGEITICGFLSPGDALSNYYIAMSAGQPETSFIERTRAAKKIIVIDFGFLGDSVHLAPALWEIKRHYAGAELHTLSAPVGAELLQMAPCVDRPWAFPLTAKSPAWWKHWDILWALRRQKFDAAFN